MTELVKYEAARHALQEAHSVDEVKDIHDKAAAMTAYARQARDVDLLQWASEIKVRAERKAGQMLKGIGKAKGGGDTSTGHRRVPVQEGATLKDMGVSKNQSSKWQKIASVSDEDFEEHVAALKEAGEILTNAPILRDATRAERVDNIVNISKGNEGLNLDKTYPIIYADPPWKYENPPMGASNRAIENHYPTMTLDEICDMPVEKITSEDSLLYLWATAPKLAECMVVIEAWGFEYRTCFVWVKDKIGMGYHARNQHELLLVAKRGSIPPPAVENRVSSVVAAPRGKHSQKPEEFYEIIENAYPEFDKIELFCRQPREGWEVWGNQSNGT